MGAAFLNCRTAVGLRSRRTREFPACDATVEVMDKMGEIACLRHMSARWNNVYEVRIKRPI